MSHPADPYASVRAQVQLHDLPFRDDSLPIKLSVMMSTCYRYSQLERSLECLARQDWKEFEVLICDDGDNEDIRPFYSQFEPYLRIKTTRREKMEFSVDPTGGFLTLFPVASGEYFMLMQPELMLYPDVCRLMYSAHTIPNIVPDVRYNPRIGTSETFITFDEIGDRQTWAVAKTYHLDPGMMQKLDGADWHTNIENICNIPRFWNTSFGLSYKQNDYWEGFQYYPWWFCASAHRDAKIFQHMPNFRGHAMIDFYTMGYRRHEDYVDIILEKPRAFHQDHVRIAVGVGHDEWDKFTAFPVPPEWR